MLAANREWKMALLCRLTNWRTCWHRRCSRSKGTDGSLCPAEHIQRFYFTESSRRDVVTPRVYDMNDNGGILPSTSRSVSTYVSGLGAFRVKSSSLQTFSSDSRTICLDTLWPTECRKRTAALLSIIWKEFLE